MTAHTRGLETKTWGDKLKNARRVFLVVLDGVGLGALPDADRYGDVGSNTLLHTAEAAGGLALPNLASWGLAFLADLPGMPKIEAPTGAFALMAEVSAGKDSTTGHWEMMGHISREAFPTYPRGFPPRVIEPFERAIGRQVLGNKAASGTRIIVELGERHLATGYPIVYTSADSVFQIAAHEEKVPTEQLYDWCRSAREILAGEDAVARVIARPFTGAPGSFVRTNGRRDFSLQPPGPTVLDALKKAGKAVIGLGKIGDLFDGRGLTESTHTPDNESTLQALRVKSDTDFEGLVFANCVDFDMRYGHRNNPTGFAAALLQADKELGDLSQSLRQGDLLMITGDHGNDPVTPSTDHSREYVPLLIAGPDIRPGSLGLRHTFADVGASLAELFDLQTWPVGSSFAGRL